MARASRVGSTASMTVLAPGAVFAGHRIEAVVGRGGMGVVYRARHLELDRVVALKVIAPELLEDGQVRARFVREASRSIAKPTMRSCGRTCPSCRRGLRTRV